MKMVLIAAIALISASAYATETESYDSSYLPNRNPQPYSGSMAGDRPGYEAYDSSHLRNCNPQPYSGSMAGDRPGFEFYK